MYHKIETWLNNVLEQKIPSKVKAFCFNLYEDENESWSIELVGTKTFDPDDEDWACDEITDFWTRYKPFSWKEKADWKEVLSEVVSALKQYLKNGLYADVLKSRAGVAVGFVDGNLEILYSNLAGMTKDETMDKTTMKDKIQQAIEQKISEWQEEDIYAISLYVFDEEDDPCRPVAVLGYNTERQVQRSVPEASDEQEARWNYAFWIQNEELCWGQGNTAEDIKEWITKQDLLDREDEITEKFVELLVAIVQDIHVSGLLRDKFGKELPILIHELEYYEKIARQNIEANGEVLDKEFISFCMPGMPEVHDKMRASQNEVQTSNNEVPKAEKSITAPRSKRFPSGSVIELCFIIAIVIIMILIMTFGAIISSRNTSDSGGKTQQTEQFSEENEDSPAAAASAEQASDSSSEAAEESVPTEASAPKRADCVQARDYFKDVIWEVKRASIFIHQQSGGQAYLKSNRWATQEPKPLYQEEELLGYYYNFTVSEVRPDSTEVRNCFYVKEDLSEILCLEAATGNLYDLESWRNSSEYAERMKEISDWQQEREERLLASEGQTSDEPWYDAYRAIVVDWTLIEDSEWSSDLDYLDFYFEEDYQFDSYWLCDIDQNGTPELFLYSDTRDMTNMVAVVTYTDRPVVVIVEMIAGLNLETAECIIYGHWHGAGGSPENEWTGYRIQGDTAEYSMYIDYYDQNEGFRESHYVIYHPETDEFEHPVDGREYEEIYATHVANCIWTWDIPKYDLVDDLSGLKVIYK